MPDFKAKATEIRTKLQNASISPSTRVVVKFIIAHGGKPYAAETEILPVLAPRYTESLEENLVNFVMNEIDYLFLHYTKRASLHILDVQVDIQKAPA